MASEGHARSHNLGSLESPQGASWRRIIILVSTLKVPKIWRAKLLELAVFWPPHIRLTPSVQGTPANIRTGFTPPESRLPGLHYCRWWCVSIFFTIFVVSSERRIIGAVVDFWDQLKARVRFPVSEINSNLARPISSRFWYTTTYWLKIANFPHSLSLNALDRGNLFRISGISRKKTLHVLVAESFMRSFNRIAECVMCRYFRA